MPLSGRGWLPIAALLLGSWVGVGRPFPVLERRPPPGDTGTAPAPQPVATSPTPRYPIEPSPLTVDPSALPDPAAFPRLNPNASIAAAWQLAQGPAYEESDKRRLVTLTFDDGPFPETTPRILSTLQKNHVRATFFLIGQYLDGTDARAEATRDVVRKMAAAGHLIGNHTHDHELLTSLSHTEALAQIDSGDRAIERVLGKKPILFRPPFGQLDSFTEQALAARGAEVVLWSVEVQDMKQKDTEAMLESLEHQIDHAGGGIVLLHDIRWSTVAVLPRLLEWLHARRYDPARPKRVGYEIVDLPSYLRATAERPTPPHAVKPRPPLPSGV